MSWYRYQEGALGELAEPRCRRDDLAHLIGSVFVLAEPEKLTGDVLNVGDAEAKAHKPCSERHQPAAYQSRETAAGVRGRNRSFSTRNLVNQRLNFVGRSLVAQKV